MTLSVKQAAEQYEPKTAKNITELDEISVDLVIQKEEGVDSENNEYSYNYITVDDERYRVPDSVLSNLKSILQKKPTLKTFSVSKTGEGRQTRYTVIPLD